MQSAVVIAQILGPLYVIVGVGLVLDPATYQRVFEAFFASPALAFLGGLLALVFGLVILAFHAAWRADWTLVVTLIGWLALLKGSLLMVCPSLVIRLSRPLMAGPGRLRTWAAAPLALGVLLSLAGYGLV